ncbi:MAG: glycoside hydrolase family 5 protein [Eubacteriales bacterium]|nr:glycoside hydrolase family 5 protein [Eubacteriales bacterium]
MRSRVGQKILLLFIISVFILTAFPMISLAAPSGSATSNCWGSGGQLEIQLSGCSGYDTITVVAEFSGTIDSASGWGFDSYDISGNRVTATCSSSGENSWGFDSRVGIQVSGSDINSAKLISVSGDGESGSVNEPASTTASTTSSGNPSSDPASNPDPARNTEGVAGDDWLTTEGSHIVDMNGTEVWLTGCNWFGYNTGTNIFDGVWNCNLKDTLKSIADHGFNVLRVPMSAELLLQWKNGEYPRANYNNAYNEELNSMNSLEIFDYVLSLCEQNGMKIIIDIHCAKTDAAGHNHPVWYNGNITEDDFVEALSWCAERYKNNDTIIGYDLKNEPHGKASETPHAIWNDSDSPDNWKKVAERAGNAVLDANPHALIIIEGIQIYPKDIKTNNFVSTNDDDDYYNTWWGANLMAVKDYPIDFGSPERNKQIIYSPHDYGPRVYEQPWFQGGFTYDSLMKDAWYDYWLYIQEEGIAPIFVGEWGGFMEGDNLKWMEYFRQLIAEKHLHHTFWCFNANSGDTGGLVKDDFKTWDEEKYNFVKEVLWQTEDGEFIGLDHAVPLGVNGIALSDYTGVKITPAPLAPASETKVTEATENAEQTTVTETSPVLAEETVQGGKSNTDITVETISKAGKELIIVAVAAVVLLIIIMAARIAVKRYVDKKREAEEEIILADPHELEVDKNNTKIENTAEDDVGDA